MGSAHVEQKFANRWSRSTLNFFQTPLQCNIEPITCISMVTWTAVKHSMLDNMLPWQPLIITPT